MTDIATLHRQFEVSHAASRASVAVDHATRMDRLARLREMLRKNDERLIAAISADFGCRVPDETRLMEITPLMNALRHTRSHLRRWMRPARRPISVIFQPGSGRVVPQPLGLVGIIAPWNYPLLLSVGPLIDVLAAGNRAMIKPSEISPRCSDLLQGMIAESFTPDEVTVVTGDATLAQGFSELPFDHLIFTGSTAVGRKVAQAAAANLTPVTLELGGKSPAIIAPDADLAKAANSIAFGKFTNAGQTCVAPDYVLAPRADLDAVAEALETRIRRSYPTLAEGYTSIVSDRHYDRQIALLAELPEVTRVVRVGEDDGAARKLAPRLVLDPPKDSRLMREEIFGPILPILPYDDLGAAMADINAGDRPLAAYCFAATKAQSENIVRGTVSGGMTVNGTLLHLAQDELPFGGVGASGIGAYHGHAGFVRFSHMKSVFTPGFLNAFEMMGPPWGRLARLTYRFLGR
jgi:coniferyl-aldehyde dehydrogenase